MDLKRPLLATLLALALAGCGEDTPFEVGDDALVLPSTLQEALPLATARARAVADGAYLTRMGGGFSVMDATGRGSSQSFLFHARVGPQSYRRITVHLVHGSPWVQDAVVAAPDVPGPFDPQELVLDSDGVVQRTVQLLPGYPAVAPAEAFSARLSSVPAWPEPSSVGQIGTAVAWRVDVLVLQEIPGSEGPPVYFSAARFYFDPETAELLGDPVIPEQPELYPFP